MHRSSLTVSVGDLTTVLVNGNVPVHPPGSTPASGRKSVASSLTSAASISFINGAHSMSPAVFLRSLYPAGGQSTTTTTHSVGATSNTAAGTVASAVASSTASVDTSLDRVPLVPVLTAPGPYAAMLMDTCEYNRGLCKHRVARLPFMDLATQVCQRPAPWLCRGARDRLRTPFSVDGTHIVVRYLRHRWRLDQHWMHLRSKRRRPATSCDTSNRQPFSVLQSDGNPIAVTDLDPLAVGNQTSCNSHLAPVAPQPWSSIGRQGYTSNGDHQKTAALLAPPRESVDPSERHPKKSVTCERDGEDSMTSSSLEAVSRRPTPDLDETRLQRSEDGGNSNKGQRKSSLLVDATAYDDDYDVEEIEEDEFVEAEGEEDTVVAGGGQQETTVDEDGIVEGVEGEDLGAVHAQEGQNDNEEDDDNEDEDDEDVEWRRSRSSRSGFACGRRSGIRRRLRGCKATSSVAGAGAATKVYGSSKRQRVVEKKPQPVGTAGRRGTASSRKTSRATRPENKTPSTAGSTGRRGSSTVTTTAGTRSVLTACLVSTGQGQVTSTASASGSHKRRGEKKFDSTWESDEPGFQPNAAIPSFPPSDGRAGTTPSRSLLTSVTSAVTTTTRHYSDMSSKPSAGSLAYPTGSAEPLANWNPIGLPVTDLTGSIVDQLATGHSPHQRCLSISGYHSQKQQNPHPLTGVAPLPQPPPPATKSTISQILSTATSLSSPSAYPTGNNDYLAYLGGSGSRSAFPSHNHHQLSDSRLRDNGPADLLLLPLQHANAPHASVAPLHSGRSGMEHRSGYFPTSSPVTMTTAAGGIHSAPTTSYQESIPGSHGNTYRQLIPPPSPAESSGPQQTPSIGTGSHDSRADGGASASAGTTVVTFFVCEVCSSRYRSTAGLRYHYHSQHSGYTPKNPISASASRLVVPLGEERAIGGGLRGGRPRRHKATVAYSDVKTKTKMKEVMGNLEDPSSPTVIPGESCASARLAASSSSSMSIPIGIGVQSTTSVHELVTADESVHRFPGCHDSTGHFQPTSSAVGRIQPSLSVTSNTGFPSPNSTAVSAGYLLPTSTTVAMESSTVGNNVGTGQFAPTSFTKRDQGRPAQRHYGSSTTSSLPLASMASMLASASGDLTEASGGSLDNGIDVSEASSYALPPPSSLSAAGGVSQLGPGGRYPVGGRTPHPSMTSAAGGQLMADQWPGHEHASLATHYYRMLATVRQRRHERQRCPDRLGMLPTPLTGSISGPTCVYCLGDDRRTGQAGGLLRCSRCDQWAHFFCLRLPAHVVQAAAHYPWQCIDCKTCWVCGSPDDPQHQMFVCASCDRAFHGGCLPSSRRPLDEATAWLCDMCLTGYYPTGYPATGN